MAMDAVSLRCSREDFLAAITAAEAVVPATSAKPICTNLQIEASAGRIEIVATDTQVGLRAIVQSVQVEQPGQAVVQARQLASILKESRSHDVGLTLARRDEQCHLAITLADGDYQVPALIGETFPAVNSFPQQAAKITISAARCEEMIRQTVFAVDRDRSSAVLSGIYLGVNEGECVLAATDGKMLCEAVEKGDSFRVPEPISVIIPAVTVHHLSRIIQSVKPEIVEIAVVGTVICFRVASPTLQVELTSRLVEGTFPAYRNALPAPGDNRVVFDSQELAGAVRRTALMTSNTARGIVLTLNGQQAVLSNLNYTNGSAKVPVTCTYGGGPMKFGVNAQYLGEVLKVYKNPRIEIELARALIIREPGVTYLVMPISLPS